MGKITSDFILNRWGESITLTRKTRTYDDSSNPREPTETSSSSTVTGLFQWVTADEEEVKSGLLQIGDAKLFVPVATDVQNEDEVTYQGHTYRVIGVQAQKTGIDTHYIECHLKKLY